MLAVDCGSAELTALRALMAAICAGVACLGAASQKPRALMMSAGVCGLASALSAAVACFGFGGCTIWTSAEASWKVAPAGLARGIGTKSAVFSAALAGAAAAITLAGEILPRAAGALAPSSSSSFDLLPNRAANR